MITPAHIFTDHAVLQAGKPVPVWGETDAAALDISFGGHTVSAKIENGRFFATLPEMEALTRGTLRFSAAGEEYTLIDIVVGEVLLLCGQSNMKSPVFCTEYDECDLADDADLRFFTVMRRPRNEKDTYEWQFDGVRVEDTPWRPCTKEGAIRFSAVGYHVARRLRRELGVPVGVVDCALGGTRVEGWLTPAAIEGDPIAMQGVEHWRFFLGKQYNEEEYLEKYAVWQGKMNGFIASRRDGLAFVREHGLSYFLSHLDPSDFGQVGGTYHTFAPFTYRREMLSRILPYAARAVLWYQGESNTVYPQIEHCESYKHLFRALVREWRRDFQNPDLPFFTVRLAPFGREVSPAWREVQRAQTELGREERLVYTVPADDCGEAENIHPIRKKPIASRLADAILCECYGKAIAWERAE